MPYSEAFSQYGQTGYQSKLLYSIAHHLPPHSAFQAVATFPSWTLQALHTRKNALVLQPPPYRSLRLPSNHKDGPLATPAPRNLARPPNSRIPCFVRPQLAALFPSCLLGQSDLTSSWICPWDRFCVRVFEPGELSESLGPNEGTNEGKCEVEEKFGLSRRKRRRSCKLSVESPNACRSCTGSGESRLSAKTVRDFT